MRDKQLLCVLAITPLVWFAVAGLLPETPSQSFSFERLLWVTLALSASEEVIFRGAVQGALLRTPMGSQQFGPLSRANLLTSVSFAALHLAAHSPVHSALVLFPSLVLGHFRERTGGLALPILLHAYFNAGYILIT